MTIEPFIAVVITIMTLFATVLAATAFLSRN